MHKYVQISDAPKLHQIGDMQFFMKKSMHF